jgi:hypothetical protein
MKDHTTILIGGDAPFARPNCGMEKIMYADYLNYEDMPDAAKSEATKKEHAEYWATKKIKLTAFETYRIINSRNPEYIEQMLGMRPRNGRHLLKMLKECWDQLNAGEQNIILCEGMEEVTDKLNGLKENLQTSFRSII